ncbi:MAG: xanthine dehydrogenase family protein [bacterium]|nr:xanthine dehydrogenase family protein [bacterium]
MMGKDVLVGNRLERVDADTKLTGRCRFLADLRFDGLLHARQARSTQIHARLVALDCERARHLPGIRAVVSAVDVPGENRIGVIIDDQPLFAADRVRYLGEPLAIVAADTEAAATAAVAVIEESARFEPLPALLSIEDSRNAAPDAIHASGPVASSHIAVRGDIEQGFAEADIVVEAEFGTGAQEHYYLEPQGCVVVPEGDGGVTVYGSMQCPFYVQKAVARVIGTTYGKVRVIQTPTGGAFGGKEDIPNELCARTALLALATDRPVRLLLERREDITSTSKRHPFRTGGRLGATGDGRLTAMAITHDADSGAYATLSPPVIFRAAIQGVGPYDIPTSRVEARGWYTNNVPSGAFRGFGSPQATFVHERLIDLMASKLKMDPVELRRINMVREGGRIATGQVLTESVGALETLERCAAAAESTTDDRRPTPADIALKPELGDDPARWMVATGFSSMIYGNCLGQAGWHMDGAGASLQIHADGSVTCSTGLTEMGQGSQTVITQMVAEALGVDPATVKLPPIDTALVPDSGPTVASRNVVMSGKAILNGAKQLLDRLRPLAAEMMAAPEDVLIFSGGEVRRPDRDGSALPFAELAEMAWRRNINLAAEGWWHVPELNFDPQTGVGDAYFAYSFATQAARVAVDGLTGQSHVLKVWAAHDVGRAVNPAGVEGQVEGGVVQGAGWALGERLVRSGGRVLSDNLSTYELPRSIDAPEIETIIVESPHSLGPYGAKSLGEPVIIPIAAAIANGVSLAIADAVNGIPINSEHTLLHLER